MTTRAINLLIALIGLAAANSFAAVDSTGVTVRFLEQRTKNDPMDSIAQNRLCFAYIAEMRQSGDLDLLERATRAARASLEAVRAAQNTGGLVALAMAQFESHNFQEALAMSRKAMAIDPGNKGALATIGDAELEIGDYAGARSAYEKLNDESEAPSVTARLARLAEICGDNQKAITLLQDAAQAENLEWYHIRLGEIFFRTGKFDEAQREYEAAQRISPGHFLVLEHLAELQAAQGRFDEAIKLYSAVISRVPRADYFQALGDVYVWMGKPVEAKPWYDKALAGYLKSVEQGNAHFLHHLAGFYSDSVENPAEAVRWASKDLEVRHSVYAHDALAWACYKNGDFNAATNEMALALAMGTRDAHIFFHASMIYSRTGQFDRGSAFLKQALEVNPRYNTFHVHR